MGTRRTFTGSHVSLIASLMPSSKGSQRKGSVITELMPAFDVDGALDRHPWDSYDNLRATATSHSDIQGHLSFRLGASDRNLTYKPANVCFYPGGGGDWEPLVRFPSCATFVYCDLALPGDHDNMPLAEMAKTISTNHRELKYLDGCFNSWEGDEFHDNMLAWEREATPYLKLHCARQRRPGNVAEEITSIVRFYRPPGELKKRSTWVGRFIRTLHGQDEDLVTILYLPVESLSAYVNLYFVNRIAPGVICLKPYEGMSCGQLSPKLLDAYAAVLKNDCAARKSVLVVPPDRKANTPWMSDWKHEHRRFDDWGRVAYSAKPEQLAPAVQQL